METVYVRMSRAKLIRELHDIPAAAKRGGPADAILVNAGKAAQRRIVQAFAVKSRGGTDETGARWATLSPVTVTKRLRKMRPTTERERPSSALSARQRKRWWDLYRRALWKFKDKSIAARVAWAQIKREGGVSHFDKYGASAVPILADTMKLIGSLVPDSHSVYKVFRVTPGQVELGTNRKGAAANHAGAINLPQRRLWPHPKNWSSAWWQEILVAARSGVVDLIVNTLW